MRLSLQFRNFVVVGIAAAVVHYGLLIALVEGARASAVVATLAGYLGGGLVSYWLNRRFTYASVRSHREAGWRFAIVAGIGFLLTGGLMQLLNGSLGWPYLLAQIVITGIVLIWSFAANRAWTFAR